MLRIYDFVCEDCNVMEERFTFEPDEVVTHSCGKEMIRRPSAPMFKLNGTDPSFPTAYDQWDKKRAEKLQQELKNQS